MKRKLAAVFGDVHCPYQDDEAVNWCLNRIRNEEPAWILIHGDMFDFENLSRFLKKPAFSMMFHDEVRECKKLVQRIERLRKKIGARVRFMGGNHESRLQKYLWRNAPALAEVPELCVPQLLKLPHEWDWMEHDQEGFWHEDTLIIHGRSYRAGSVCNANLRRYLASVVQGHSHRVSSAYKGVPGRRRHTIGAAELGCLCQIDPNYAKHTDWSHAMGWLVDGLPHVEMKESRL